MPSKDLNLKKEKKSEEISPMGNPTMRTKNEGASLSKERKKGKTNFRNKRRRRKRKRRRRKRGEGERGEG